MAAVLPLLPERHRAAPKPALLWILGLAGGGILRCHRCLGIAATRSSTSRRSACCWSAGSRFPSSSPGSWPGEGGPTAAFGPLMILAGFVTQLSILQWTNQPLLNTVGQLCDLLVAAVWLHVFLAYPTGRLAGRAERVGGDHRIRRRGRPPGRDLDAGRVQRSPPADRGQAANRRGSRAERAAAYAQRARAHWRGAALAALAGAATVAAAATGSDRDQLLQPVTGHARRPAHCRRVPASRLRDHPVGNLRSRPGWRHSPSLRDCSMLASPRQASASCWYSCARARHQTSGSYWPRRCATRPCP